MTYNVIDLFCGIGGFSKGFEKAGFNVIAGIDNWKVALETFGKNHINTDIINSDIRNLDDEFLRKYTNKIDVLIAGPPCQGFSMSGKRNPKDERNTLFEEVIRVVSVIKPKIVVIENVVGLLSMKNPNGEMIKNLIIEKFNRIGYETKYKILNAADFGVPQKRKRVIFMASLNENIDFPDATNSENSDKLKPWITVGDALGNIPDTDQIEYLNPRSNFQKIMANGTSKIYNHESQRHNKNVVRRMSLVPQGGNWKNIPPEFYNVGGEHSNNYRRLDPEKPAITLKHASKSMIIHPVYNRCLTVREVARLQSFYDSFILLGTKFEQHQQLANAVPPLLGYAIAKHIKNVLDKKLNN